MAGMNIAVILVAAVVVGGGVGAYVLLSDDGGNGGEGGDISVIDSRNKTIYFDTSPTRVLSLGSSFTDTLITLGCAEQICAVDQSSATRLIGSGAEYDALQSVEKISSGNPANSDEWAAWNGIDCVFVWNFDMYSSGIASMESLGLKVVALYPTNVETIQYAISVIGTVMGKADEASAFNDMIDSKITLYTEMAMAKAGSEYGNYKKVYAELDTATHTSPGTTSITGTMFDILGVSYLGKAKNETATKYYGSEDIAWFDPDVLLFMGPVAPGYDVTRGGLIKISGKTTDIYNNAEKEGFNGNWASATPSFIRGLEYLYELIYGDGSGDEWQTVTFDPDNGKAAWGVPVLKGTPVAKPDDPVNKGYEFAGWSCGGEPWDFADDVTEDITLTAEWTLIPGEWWTVTFDPDNGGAAWNVPVLKGTPVAEPKDPEYEGYEFAGWSCGGEPWDFADDVTEDITLTAEWTPGEGG